ncbi:hypothetical protein [Mesorhizobium sp. KR9-304]|uniref:hypothetical protein n=1 Tax=Mesorhizobium sp. KR9-304 TaxID=3156614 RepID=UPI0032B3BFB8
MEAPDNIAAAMAGLRKTIEERLADGSARAGAQSALAQYDTVALGRLIRPLLEKDGRGWRALAAEIGVTSPDLSRVISGQTVSAAKIFAICDWAGIDPRRFYRPAKKRAVKPKRFTGKALKQDAAPS